MSPTNRTPGRSTPPAPEQTVELPVAAEPTLPPGVPPHTSGLDPSAYMAQVVAFCRDLQPAALLLWQVHDDETVRTLAEQLYGLTSAVEAVARVNA